MEKIKCTTIMLLFALIITSCGGGKKNNPDPVINPTASLLIFPDKDAACIIGDNTSATQSTVTFKWQNAQTADSYDVTIKNLVNGNIITKTAASAQVNVLLALNTPYAWFVTSKVKNNNNTATSDTWRFYNSGPGVSAYTPFPAEILTPANGQKINAVSGKVNLSWSGKDIDNDIVDYDIYIDTSPNPALLKANITDSNLAVNVNTKTTYYWKVITRDSKNNRSNSGIFSFVVN